MLPAVRTTVSLGLCLLAAACSPADPRPGSEPAQTLSAALAWSEVQTLDPTDADMISDFGRAAAIDGDWAVLGAGSSGGSFTPLVYVFEKVSGTWTQRATLRPDPPNDVNNTFFGFSVDIFADRVIVGAPELGGAGGAFVFKRTGTAWAQEARLTPSMAPQSGDRYGHAVSIGANYAFVGAPVMFGGYVDAYRLIGGPAWNQHGRATGPSGFGFGKALSQEGDEAIAGSPDGWTLSFGGAAWRLTPISPGSTVSSQRLTAGGMLGDSYAQSVAFGPQVIAVGSPNTGAAGQVDLIAPGATTAFQTLDAPPATSADAQFGAWVQTSGDRLFVGAPTDDQGAQDSGSVFVYREISGTWTLENRLLAGDAAAGAQFGVSGGVSGDDVIVGATGAGTPTNDHGYAFRFLSEPGEVCSVADDCTTGFCAGGLCCDAACDGPCETCAASLGASADGTCTLLTAGAEAAVCLPYLCDGLTASCPTSCTTDGDCLTGSSCSPGSECIGLDPVGTACTDAFKCATGFCVDGVCCDTECSGQCEACNESGTEGACSAVMGAPRGSRQACVDEGDACAGSCDGALTASCAYPDSVPCGTRACEGNASRVSECNGQGRCVEQPEVLCSPYRCGSDRCLTSCGDDGDCAQGFACDDSECRQVTGSVCVDDATLEASDGSQTSCDPYVCSGDRCLDTCTSTAECADGFICETTRQPPACVRSGETEGPSDDGGCGCRAAARGAPSWPWALALVAAMLRRRRSARSL